MLGKTHLQLSAHPIMMYVFHLLPHYAFLLAFLDPQLLEIHVRCVVYATRIARHGTLFGKEIMQLLGLYLSRSRVHRSRFLQ